MDTQMKTNDAVSFLCFEMNLKMFTSKIPKEVCIFCFVLFFPTRSYTVISPSFSGPIGLWIASSKATLSCKALSACAFCSYSICTSFNGYTHLQHYYLDIITHLHWVVKSYYSLSESLMKIT